MRALTPWVTALFSNPGVVSVVGEAGSLFMSMDIVLDCMG